MFLCGLSPVIISVLITLRVKEPERWKKSAAGARRQGSLAQIFSAKYRRKTIVNAALLTVAIIGLWAGAVYEPTAIITLAKKAGMSLAQASKMASIGTAILSIGTILGCLMAPKLAERLGRKKTLAIYFVGMSVFIWLSFGWAFYLDDGLKTFITCLFFLGFFGGNFTLFSLWLPEQYETSVRATAFAFATSFGRFIGAGVNFMIGAMVRHAGTIGKPVAYTAIAFGLGLLIIPFAQETRGQALPN
jgi:MFS family permease